MATQNEIIAALKILSGARLRNAPDKDAAPVVVDTWKSVMADVPGNLLIQAVNDIVINAEFWPTIKQVRDAAYQVRAHNGTSAAVNHFSDPSNKRAPLKGIARVTAEGWLAVFAEDLHPIQEPELEDIEPPAHPEFTSWAEAQAWQEAQREVCPL